MTLSEEKLLTELKKAQSQVEVGAIYTHYRNKTPYKVISLAILEATQEVGIIYLKASDPLTSVTWIRPISSFSEKIDIDGVLVHRFQKI